MGHTVFDKKILRDCMVAAHLGIRLRSRGIRWVKKSVIEYWLRLSGLVSVVFAEGRQKLIYDFLDES